MTTYSISTLALILLVPVMAISCLLALITYLPEQPVAAVGVVISAAACAAAFALLWAGIWAHLLKH